MALLSAVGCADISPPKDTTVSREGNQAVVTCTFTDQKWRLECRGVHWLGVLGNCSKPGWLDICVRKHHLHDYMIAYGLYCCLFIYVATATPTQKSHQPDMNETDEDLTLPKGIIHTYNACSRTLGYMVLDQIISLTLFSLLLSLTDIIYLILICGTIFLSVLVITTGYVCLKRLVILDIKFSCTVSSQ